jgi:hypothetical protein
MDGRHEGGHDGKEGEIPNAPQPAFNRISILLPVALAYLRKEAMDGARPLSSRATADCEVPMRLATCACVSFARVRALSSSASSS